MLGFIINIIRLLRAIIHGVRYDQEFRILLFFLVSLLSGSTIFYWQNEGWSVIDSLYFSVMTMSTIGYDGFVPTTTSSKIFTIIFTFLSIGVFVSMITKIVAVTLKQKQKAVKKIKSIIPKSDKHSRGIKP